MKRKQLEAKLDPRQIKAALLCVEREFTPQNERKTTQEIADEIGVSRKTLYQWRTQNRAFIDYANFLADDFLSAERAFVYRQLMKTISGEQPSIKGIDLYFRRHGLITERQVVENATAGEARTNDDIAKEIEELDEILDGVETEDADDGSLS